MFNLELIFLCRRCLCMYKIEHYSLNDWVSSNKVRIFCMTTFNQNMFFFVVCLFLFTHRSSQPVKPPPATRTASRTLSGETHACRWRHPGRLWLGLHCLKRGTRWPPCGTTRVATEVSNLLCSPVWRRTDDNPTENKWKVVFKMMLDFFFFSNVKRLMNLKTIIVKPRGQTSMLCGTNPWGKHDVKRVTTRQSVVQSSVNCFLLTLNVFPAAVCVLCLQSFTTHGRHEREQKSSKAPADQMHFMPSMSRYSSFFFHIIISSPCYWASLNCCDSQPKWWREKEKF